MTLKDIYISNIADEEKSYMYKTIHRYSKKSKTITEFGTGDGKISASILGGQGKYSKLISYDIVGSKLVKDLKDIAKKERKYFSYLWGDTTKIEIDDTDILIIDTKHNANHLWAELYDNHKHVDKSIIICGTEEYGEFGEDDGHLGLNSCINKFLESNDNWKIKTRYKEGYGFIILNRG